jgi:hypothetical protein
MCIIKTKKYALLVVHFVPSVKVFHEAQQFVHFKARVRGAFRFQGMNPLVFVSGSLLSAPCLFLNNPLPPSLEHTITMPDITNNSGNPPRSVPTTAAEVSHAQQEIPTLAPRPQRPLSQHSTMSSPSFLSPSRPESPSGSLGRRPEYMRRPSSSLSSSSRRASMLTQPDPSYPQRLPRQPGDAQAFAELHQELEVEQEAQVNRLLQMIRLQSLQAANANEDATSTSATIDSGSVRTDRPRSPASASAVSRRSSNRFSRDGSLPFRHRSLSRGSSTHLSSPGMTPGGADSVSEASVGIGSSYSDAGYYAAESQMLKRENEMLKRRIRELERTCAELSAKASASAGSNSTTDTTPTENDTTPAESGDFSP